MRFRWIFRSVSITGPVVAGVVMAGLAFTLAVKPALADSWRSSSIRGDMPDLAFTLTDENGETVHGRDFRGFTTLIYFGYTHCPDVCPTTLARLHTVLTELGDAATDVRVLFVSVDPNRDTPASLKTYTAYFDPRIVGLSGSRGQLDALSKRYRTAYLYGPPDDDGNYAVYHSAKVFVFDGRGRARLVANKQSATIPAIGHDLRKLLRSTPPRRAWLLGR